MQHQFGTLIRPGIVTYWKKIQRRSARFVKGDHRTTSSVTRMLHDLGWRDLSDRRRDLRLTLLYKVVTGHVAVGPDQIGLVAADNRTKANHQFKFRAIGASSSGLRSSFAARTVGDWNQLPVVVYTVPVSASSWRQETGEPASRVAWPCGPGACRE